MPLITQPKSSLFHFPEVRVVGASAGSGKTYALAKRYVQLLLKEAGSTDLLAVRSLLAVTFTNKAALEMKERILTFLKRIAIKDCSSRDFSAKQLEDILSPLGIDADEAARRAFAIMEGLLRNYNFFQVQTIDSFIKSMLSSCAFKIGLSANFKIKSQYHEYLEYCLDELIDQARRDRSIRRMFSEFLDNYLYLENRSDWFPKKVMLSIVRNLYSQGTYYSQTFRPSPYSREEIIARKKTVIKDMRELLPLLPEKTHKGFLNSFQKFLKPERESFDVDDLPDYFAREEVPVNKGEEVSGEVHRLWQRIRQNLTEGCEAEAFSIFNPYLEILAGVMTNLRAQTSKDDVLFLQDMNKKARALFDGEGITVEELYLRLATRLRHYLIDEFQDTSRLNWENIERMVEEALSTGGTLFYVGDKKQAIYNFRGGDISLFDELKTCFPNCPVKEEPLTNNWRSRQAIVEFNNFLFSGDNLTRFLGEVGKKAKDVEFSDENQQRVRDVFEESRQTFQADKPGGYIRVERVDLKTKEERNAETRGRVLKLIADLRSRYSCRDIAVLTRSNQEVEEVTGWLLTEGIAVDSERTSDLRVHPLICELISLLKFLDSPIDNVSFVRFLVGEMFSAISGVDNAEMHRFVFSLRDRLKAEKDFYVYREFREKYPNLWERYFDPFFRNVGLYPTYELIVSMYHRYGLVDRFAGAQGFFMHFLELVKTQEEDCPDIAAFLKYFEESEGDDFYVPVAGEEMVRVLTIHKAKGLEFPVVILPFLGMEVQVGSRSDDNKFSYILRPAGDDLFLLRLKKNYGLYSRQLKRLFDEEYHRTLLAELNAVYVALTRASGEMYIFIPSKCRQGSNLVQCLIPEDFIESGAPLAAGEVKPRREELWRLPASSYYDWIAYLKDEFVSYEEVRHQDKRREGQILHFLLSNIGNANDLHLPTEMEKALRACAAEFAMHEEREMFRQRLTEIIGHANLKPFFFNGNAQVFTEKEIVTAAGNEKRMDRLIVGKNEVWVVDYKLAYEREGRYGEQVAEYMTLLKPLYPKHTIKGFLVYLDTLNYEQVTG